MTSRSNLSAKVMATFLVPNDDPLREEFALLAKFVEEFSVDGAVWYIDFKLKSLESGRSMLERSNKEQALVVRAFLIQLKKLIDLNETLPTRPVWSVIFYLLSGVNELLKRKLPLEERDVECLVGLILDTDLHQGQGVLQPRVLKVTENFFKENEPSEKLVGTIQKLIIYFDSLGNRSMRNQADRLSKLLGIEKKVRLESGEAWSDTALHDLKKQTASGKSNWEELLLHCQSASTGKPSTKWLRTAGNSIENIGEGEIKSHLLRWFPLVDKPRTQPLGNGRYWSHDPNLHIIDEHADILKGLAWCCSLFDDAEIARALTQLAISAYKKVPGIGPRAVKVGNACVYALGAMPGMDAVGQLALLKVRIKFRTAQNGIEKALTAAAERKGIPRDEIEEMSVPAYGLTEVGLLREPLGEFTAELAVEGRKPEIRWIKPDGKRQKTVPAAVKKEYGEELKELKASAKDIEKMLPAQATRIEQAYLQQKEWSFDVWRERYLDHPLVGILARRLIWKFQRDEESVSAIFYDDQFVGSDDQPIDCIDEKATVQLWHPLDESTDEIVAWRDWLLTHEVQQPFKQAYREVYLLTDAERNTGVYSNRFAAHVLKQHQFNALCGARGWKNQLRLAVDDDCPPTHIVLPQWDLRAEFWVESVGEEWGVDTNDAGTFYYLTTDQVRFYRSQAAMNWTHVTGGQYESAGQDEPENHPLPLDTIPPLVLSEVLRDVDLFVGVASVGNDPNWGDGGAEGRYRDYWNDYSFGDLAATAQTRKSVLERLVPRLKIADRCTLNERFLVVRGDVRTYKIHLGSGNILMEPNDAYLCIVPAQSTAKAADKVFLPFEGDRTLSIILSKAFLLAEDKKIKDPSILSQIRG